ncbi:MAG: DNA gyrase C-terminal beta-propeller domain-containing protein, partial [Spirochaetales bacterium]
HRNEVVTRRIKYELRKAEERAHILRALIIAIDAIDEVIKIIRSSRDTQTAKNALTERFAFDDIQAQAIVDMQLKRLTSLEIETLKKELEELEIFIAKCKDLLANPDKILKIVKEETAEIAQKFGDDRRTDIISDEVEEINIEDLIKEEDMVILISHLGYIKTVPVTAYKNQGKGGKGSNSAKLAEDDYIKQIFIASTHDHIMFISTEGKAYWIKVHEIPEAGRNSRGAHIKSLLAIGANEEIATVVSLREFSEETYLFMAAASGKVIKVKTSAFRNAKTRGIIAINLSNADKIVSAILTEGNDEIVLASRRGQVLRLSETQVRVMGRGSGGVTGLKLSANDEIAGAVRVTEDSFMLLVTEHGFGKRVAFDEFSSHGRATSGQRGYKTTDKTGETVSLISVSATDEVVCITSQGKTLKLEAEKISQQSRTSMGVCILKIDPPDFVIGVDKIVKDA